MRHEMRILSVRAGVLLAVACFVSLAWITSTPQDEGSPQQSVLYDLYERLLVAQEVGVQVSRDLIAIVEELKNMSKLANITHPTTTDTRLPNGSDPQMLLLLPNIYFFLPHLRQHPSSILPKVVVGQGRRGVSIVLGVPTVKRVKQSYLVSTLSSLLYGLSFSQQQDLLIVVFVAETDSDYVSSVADTVRKHFPRQVESGLMEVVSPSQFYYPDLTNLRQTFGDTAERVKWRTKQNLDFSFLMLYAQDKGNYYVQLEDDVIAKVGYYTDMKTFVTKEDSKEWLFLEFSQLGFIGKMFRTHDLPMIAEFFLMFYRDKPIDWLLDHILWVKSCNPEKDAKHCDEQKALLKKRHKPSLFQHVGLHSSLPGKIQNLKDKDFGKQALFQARNNPAAEVSSSLTHYQQHSLDRAYRGEDFFWALTPTQNDYVLFTFPKPLHISRYVFRSGNIETSGDQLYNTTVEVLPSSVSVMDKELTGYRKSDKGFIIIGAFENGAAEGDVDDALQPLSALRLVVQSDADVWALLSEIHIQV
ncbi:alpha-1,3-mannosyl-glycoprotein 4-beta-N-acetylglucosaminyltransferase B-like [Antennarius striatus]|uniref:alpha-1,3-mannosyl-glycoprotein 4-beta-N-acetylglucosaminyltransferase B-like n=1 Tax=Antennarius striatus TaxID=241820 RepID=UPI0035B1ACD2